MTLDEALAHADAMTTADRWTAVTACGLHHLQTLARTTTARQDGSPYVCLLCWTVFGAGSCRVWNPPVRPRATHHPRVEAGVTVGTAATSATGRRRHAAQRVS
jgi:hypothetical protein